MSKPTADNNVRYNTDLKTDIKTKVGSSPHARMHSKEWSKIMQGDPVEINPSTGSGFRVMTVDEWAARWKHNEDFPECLGCGGKNTKEHYFVQTWCRGRKWWESELLCLDCHQFSWREYKDPDFKTPEEWDKLTWTETTREHMRNLQLQRLAVK